MLMSLVLIPHLENLSFREITALVLPFPRLRLTMCGTHNMASLPE